MVDDTDSTASSAGDTVADQTGPIPVSHIELSGAAVLARKKACLKALGPVGCREQGNILDLYKAVYGRLSELMSAESLPGGYIINNIPHFAHNLIIYVL